MSRYNDVLVSEVLSRVRKRYREAKEEGRRVKGSKLIEEEILREGVTHPPDIDRFAKQVQEAWTKEREERDIGKGWDRRLRRGFRR